MIQIIGMILIIISIILLELKQETLVEKLKFIIPFRKND